MNLKKKLSIISIDIIDYNNHTGSCSFDNISIIVDIILYRMRFTIEYKMSGSQLKHLESSLEYPLINSICIKHKIDFKSLMETIRVNSNAKVIWDNYIKNNYDMNNFILKRKKNGKH